MNLKPNALVGVLLLFAVAVGRADPAEDWPGWRGPTGNGIAAEGQTPPTQWSNSQNVLWKVAVQGRGHSSPIVVEGKVILTTAEEQRQIQAVICYDRQTGEGLWQTVLNRGGFPRRIHDKNTHATPTPAWDGERVFVSFYQNDQIQLAALDLQGNILWQKSAGGFRPRAYQYGYAASPIVHDSLVIVSSEFEGGGFIAAFDRATGDEVWRRQRPDQISYSTPIVAEVAGRKQLLLSGSLMVASYDPDTGEPLWSQQGVADVTCGTVVWDGDIVFASGGYPQSETLAIKADGSGQVLWRNRQKCYEQSMIAHEGDLYAVTDAGVAFCWKGDTGEEMWSERLAGPISASPVLANGNIYATNERGKTFVFRADPNEFQLVASNQLGDEGFASPVICGGQIFLRVAENASGRRQEVLYCIGE